MMTGKEDVSVRKRGGKIDLLVERLRDQRSKRVVFLSHCLLNENTRYLGGACRQACVREILEQCIERGIGMVQMPCPEQEAWGGVLKRHMLRVYGTARAEAPSSLFERALGPIVVGYTRLIYRRLARRIAAQIDDYLSSGFSVLGVVAVDGSPSCGLHKSVDIAGSIRALARLDPARLSLAQQSSLLRHHSCEGRGIFIDELHRALRRRKRDVPFVAHDLWDELDGRASRVQIGTESATSLAQV
jgi:predicted secreted protein